MTPARLRAVFLGVIAALMTAFLVPAVALAGGTVRAKSATIQEEEGKWKLELIIDYGGTPELQFIPVNFSFEQVVLYERALTDEGGDKPVVNKKQLQNQQPNVEGMDVGFSDGSGKILKTTKFTVVLKRDRGFEAGEYMLTLRKADGGQQIGQKLRLTLNGDNPVINRKSLNFGTDGAKVETDPSKVKSKSLADAEAIEKDKAQHASENSGDGSGDSSTNADNGSVKPKQGGCGCEIPSDTGSSSSLWALAALAAAASMYRRARRV